MENELAQNCNFWDILRSALVAEWKTDYGRANVFGTFLAFGLAFVSVSGSWVRDVLRMLLVLCGKNPNNANFESSHDTLLVIAPFVAMFLCVSLLVWMDFRAKGKRCS